MILERLVISADRYAGLKMPRARASRNLSRSRLAQIEERSVIEHGCRGLLDRRRLAFSRHAGPGSSPGQALLRRASTSHLWRPARPREAGFSAGGALRPR